ncbi:hypothetical protein J437_LFUL003753 [Ladona fulva]|uniref:RecA family profile 1 domain-containing protein n=1 Tax=Ladona fulva TaxID=123851 RepID=A0A8K0JWF6_LADFU|nr:hypothetical protein J437_LFUL003753 [Ladona fulva]
MARLSTKVCSLLTDTAITNMNSRKIFTFVDFLQEDPEKLVKICQLSYTEIMIIRRNLVSHYSAFPKNGLDAYNDLLMHSAIIPSGIPSLDIMIDGGFLTGSLTEFYGLPSSGKTQLCFTLLANAALNFKQQVQYIDCKGDFSGKRVQKIVEAHCKDPQVIAQAMQNVIVTSVGNIYQLLSFLHHLKGNMNHDNTDEVCTRLIIIDSLPAIFYQFLGENSNDGLGLMNALVATLRNIAVENRIAFILVNLAKKGTDEDTDYSSKYYPVFMTRCQILKPALGNYWLHVPNLRLYLHKSTCGKESNIVITKSSSLPIGKHCKVKFSEKGVE